MKFHIKFILITFFALFLIFSLNIDASAKALEVGDNITDFALANGITGKKVSYKEDIHNKSKLIIITFITTTCTACKAEMIVLNEIITKYEDVKLYAVCVDMNGKTSVPRYDKTFKYDVTYMLDPDFKVPLRFGFSYTPSLVIAKGDGEILFKKGGYSAEVAEELYEIVEEALQ